MITIGWLLAAGLGMTGPIQETPPARPDAAAATAGTRPSADHDRLDALAGTWRMERTIFLPGQAPQRTTGTSENRWILDNRYLECRAREGDGGSATQTVMIYGFDVNRRKYFSLAIGSRGTSYRNVEGFYDEPASSLVLLGREAGDETTPGPKLRQVVHIENRNRHVLELFTIVPGRLPSKVTEIIYTRE